MTTEEIIAGAVTKRTHGNTKLEITGNASDAPIAAQELVDWLKANPAYTQLDITSGTFDDAAPLVAYFVQSPALSHIAISEEVGLPDLPGDKKALPEIALAIGLSRNPHVYEVCLAGNPSGQILKALCESNLRSRSAQRGDGSHVDSLMAEIGRCGGLPPMG